MTANHFIRVTHVCNHCKVEPQFIQALHEFGHIQLMVDNNEQYIREEELKAVERYIYFHTELQINLEGIDAIAHLLHQIEELQEELVRTKNKPYLFHTVEH